MAWVIEPPKGYQKRCSCCGALIGYVGKDIKTKVDGYGGELRAHQYIYCPSCDKKIIIKIF